jgi:hypothetical protein
MRLVKKLLMTLFCVKPSLHVITLTEALEFTFLDLAAKAAILENLILKINKREHN